MAASVPTTGRTEGPVDPRGPVGDAGAVKHRMAVAGALAIGVMIAFLMVGRARAEVPPRDGWDPEPARATAVGAPWWAAG